MIDLHMHTVASDGALTTPELLRACEKLKLELISITDHYSVGAYQALSDPGVRALFSGEILPGCEYSAHFNGCGIEVLGYGIDPETAAAYIETHYMTLQEKRKWELEKLIACYRQRGFLFDEKRVRAAMQLGYDSRRTIFTELDRYAENIAKYSNPASHGDHKCFSRSEVFNPNSPYFISEEGIVPSLQEVCAFIHESGGRSILAHPCSYDETVQHLLEEMIESAHLDGLEAYYLTFNATQRQDLLALCRKYHLICSAGSDFHNDQRSRQYGNVLGMKGFEKVVPIEEITAWVRQLNRI